MPNLREIHFDVLKRREVVEADVLYKHLKGLEKVRWQVDICERQVSKEL